MHDELDQILDEAVKSYAAIEPPPDFPARILHQAQQEPAPGHNRWRLALAVALPLAAALALAFLLPSQWTLPKPPATIASVPSTPSMVVHPHPRSAEILAASASEPLQIHHRARKIASRSSQTRPLPPPYSKEELALLTFVQQHPKEAAKIAEVQKQEVADASKPIAIPPIQIKPLTIAALN